MDTLTKEERSRHMARITGDGLEPETRLRAALAAVGLEFESNPRVNGLGRCRPDLLFREARLAVFVHGCFWHGCPAHYRTPKTRSEHWDAHIGGNKRRDARTRRKLNALGYRTAVVWEHDLKTSRQAAAAAERVRKILVAIKQAVC